MPDNIQNAYSSEGTAIFTSRVSFNAPTLMTGLASFTTVRVGSGAALLPSMAFTSEASLGWYRSNTSRMALSYGQVEAPAGSAAGPSFTFTSDVSRGFYRSAASTIAITSGTTFNWRTGAVKWSWDTRANADGLSTGELAIVFLASGISLVYSSGNSVYVIGQSSQSAAQA